MPAKGTNKKNRGTADNPKPYPRSDGQGLRYPVKIRIEDDLELTLLNAQGRKLDGRRGVVREAQRIFREHVAELGGVEEQLARRG